MFSSADHHQFLTLITADLEILPFQNGGPCRSQTYNSFLQSVCDVTVSRLFLSFDPIISIYRGRPKRWLSDPNEPWTSAISLTVTSAKAWDGTSSPLSCTTDIAT